MDLNIVILIAQIIVSILMVVVILMQQKGAGLGSAFGGGDAVYTTRRGPEKFIFNSTIILAVLFLGLSIVAFFLQ
ncbi:MAG: preprotein translocase subunit SecG [bacterium]|nr:preprotein translocase subunit SecG [bacterium]